MQTLYHSEHELNSSYGQQDVQNSSSIIIKVPSAKEISQDDGQQNYRPRKQQHRTVFTNSNRYNNSYEYDRMNSAMNAQSIECRHKFMNAVESDSNSQQILKSRSYVKQMSPNRQSYNRRPSQIISENQHQARMSNRDQNYTKGQCPNSGIIYNSNMSEAPGSKNEHDSKQMKGKQSFILNKGHIRQRSNSCMLDARTYSHPARRRASDSRMFNTVVTSEQDFRRGNVNEIMNRNNELVYKQCERRPSVMGGVMTLTDVNKYIYGHFGNKNQTGRRDSNVEIGNRPKSGFRPGRRRSSVDGRYINIQVAKEFVNSNRRSSTSRLQQDQQCRGPRASMLTDREENKHLIDTTVIHSYQQLPKPQFSGEPRDTRRNCHMGNAFPGRNAKKNRKHHHKFREKDARVIINTSVIYHEPYKDEPAQINDYDGDDEYRKLIESTRRSEVPPAYDAIEQYPLGSFDESINLNSIPEIIIENQQYAPIINDTDDKEWNKSVKQRRRSSTFDNDFIDGTSSRPNSSEVQRRGSTYYRTPNQSSTYHNTTRRPSQGNCNNKYGETMFLRNRPTSSIGTRNNERPSSAITRRLSDSSRRSSCIYNRQDAAPQYERRNSYINNQTSYNQEDMQSRSSSRGASGLIKESVVYVPISVKTFNASEVLAGVPTLVLSQNKNISSQRNQNPQHQLQTGAYLSQRRRSSIQENYNRAEVEQKQAKRSSIISLAGVYINDASEAEVYRPSSRSSNRRRSSILENPPYVQANGRPRAGSRIFNPNQHQQVNLDRLKFIDISKQSTDRKRYSQQQFEKASSSAFRRRPTSAVMVKNKQLVLPDRNRRKSYAGDNTVHVDAGQKVEVITGMVPRIVVTSEPKRKKKKPYVSITLGHDEAKGDEYLRVPGWSDSEEDSDDEQYVEGN